MFAACLLFHALLLLLLLLLFSCVAVEFELIDRCWLITTPRIFFTTDSKSKLPVVTGRSPSSSSNESSNPSAELTGTLLLQLQRSLFLFYSDSLVRHDWELIQIGFHEGDCLMRLVLQRDSVKTFEVWFLDPVQLSIARCAYITLCLLKRSRAV